MGKAVGRGQPDGQIEGAGLSQLAEKGTEVALAVVELARAREINGEFEGLGDEMAAELGSRPL